MLYQLQPTNQVTLTWISMVKHNYPSIRAAFLKLIPVAQPHNLLCTYSCMYVYRSAPVPVPVPAPAPAPYGVV